MASDCIREPAGESLKDRIIRAVIDFQVDAGAQWIILSKMFPGVTYFATDLDPRSFDYDEARCLWVGRAELLLKAVGELRPGQFEPISFTLPARVELAETDGELSVERFDFCALDDAEDP